MDRSGCPSSRVSMCVPLSPHFQEAVMTVVVASFLHMFLDQVSTRLPAALPELSYFFGILAILPPKRFKSAI